MLTLGNLNSLLAWLFAIPIGTGVTTIIMAVLIYLYIFWRYRPLQNLAKIRFSLKNFSLAIGAGLLLALPPALFFLFPVVVGNLDYTPIKELTMAGFLTRVFLEIPLTTALSEEILFRHYLYEKIQTRSWLLFLGLHGLIFTLWHLVVCLRTVLDTNLDNANVFLGIFAYIGALVSIFVGGIVFLLVRKLTDIYFYSAISHWLNVALMTTVIWFK